MPVDGEGAIGARTVAAARTPFEEFYEKEWPGAVRFAGLLTQQAHVAEDLAQDAFARVLPNWTHVDNPHAYLRTTVVNVCRTWHARSRTERTAARFLDRSEPAAFGFDDLADAVAALPYRQRAVLVLRYHVDLTEAEIAQALGCRPGTVKSLASRALASLKEGIKE